MITHPSHFTDSQILKLIAVSEHDSFSGDVANTLVKELRALDSDRIAILEQAHHANTYGEPLNS